MYTCVNKGRLHAVPDVGVGTKCLQDLYRGEALIGSNIICGILIYRYTNANKAENTKSIRFDCNKKDTSIQRYPVQI